MLWRDRRGFPGKNLFLSIICKFFPVVCVLSSVDDVWVCPHYLRLHVCPPCPLSPPAFSAASAALSSIH